MASIIISAAGDNEAELSLAVREEPTQVQDAWLSGQGVPFRLTRAVGDSEVWVNPHNIASWFGRA